MPTTLAVVQAETLHYATNWSQVAAAAIAVISIVGDAAWLAAFAWLALRRRWRPSPMRMAVGVAAFAGIALSLAAPWALDVAQRVDVVWAAVVLAVPFGSVIAVAGGVVWIALRWRVEDRTRCGGCGHALLADQSACPECGSSRTGTWGPRQARVFTATMLALACSVLSFLAVVGIGALSLDWQARFAVGMKSRDDLAVALIRGDAVVHVRAIAPWRDERDGTDRLIRSIAPAKVFDYRSSAQGGVRWKAFGDRDAIASLSPETAAATASWIATVEARSAGSKAKFDESISVVDTWIELVQPHVLATVAAVLAGPCATLALALALRQAIRRRSG